MKKTIAGKFLIVLLLAVIIPSGMAVVLLFNLLSAHDSLVSGHLKNISKNKTEIMESYKDLIVGKKKRFQIEAKIFCDKIEDSLKTSKDPVQVIKSSLDLSVEIAQISLYKKGAFNNADELFNLAESTPPSPLFKVERSHLLKKKNKFVTLIKPGLKYEIKLKMATNLSEIKNYNNLGEIYQDNQQLLLIFKGIRKYYWYIFFVALIFIILITSAIAGLILRGIARKIGILAEATKGVAEGDLQTRVHLKGSDELSILGSDFNDMVDNLLQTQNKIRYLERMGAWQEVARNLAHEIKNPLTPILLAVQQIEGKVPSDNESFKNLVETASAIVKEEVNTLKRLVENFGTLARLPDKKVEPIQLAKMLTELIELASLTWQDCKIIFPDSIPESMIIMGDKMLLKRALLNIIENGIHAMETSEEECQMVLKVKIKNKRVKLIFEDNGSGILEPEKIFDPYYTSKEEGTGLGLPLSKKIILDISGNILAENRASGGAKITVTLPISDQ
jgi:signal transduction histidine kinase